eukprot:TRINITY_DN66145_c3_g1_i2.p1 TRINITY_DN66145_c3_g1~~TRINITY_DN66145_c3_g1_i2.p1  ORF type:complete len:533 (-),score=219.18 TRINITY_DN66145_c3_g1_i2:271-1761(-)
MHERIVNLGSLRFEEADMAMRRFRMLVFRVIVDQPLYVSRVVMRDELGDSVAHVRFNRTSLGDDDGLEGSFRVVCGDQAFVLRCGEQHELWHRPKRVLMPMHSLRNPFNQAMALFEAFGEHDQLPDHTANAIDMMLLHDWNFRSDSNSTRSLDVDSCTLDYVSADHRGKSSNDSTTTTTATTATTASPESAAFLASYRGDEMVIDKQRFEAASCPVERSMIALSDETAWQEQALELADDELDSSHSRLTSFGASSSSGDRRDEPITTALIRERMRAGIPGADLILKPVMSGVLKPVIKTSTVFVAQDLQPVAVADSYHSIMEQVMPDVTAMLQETLAANLSAILTDSVTFTLSKAMSLSLTRAVGPYLVRTVGDSIIPKLTTILDTVLQKKVPKKVNAYFPGLLDRVLPITLTHSLTRSLSHTIVPALTHTLMMTRKEGYYCALCTSHNMYCSKCHVSRSSIYYSLYHSSYFVDYYSDYYADYYDHALRLQVLFAD